MRYVLCLLCLVAATARGQFRTEETIEGTAYIQCDTTYFPFGSDSLFLQCAAIDGANPRVAFAVHTRNAFLFGGKVRLVLLIDSRPYVVPDVRKQEKGGVYAYGAAVPVSICRKIRAARRVALEIDGVRAPAELKPLVEAVRLSGL